VTIPEVKIKSWVARSESAKTLRFFRQFPIRREFIWTLRVTDWKSGGYFFELPCDEFPSLAWADEPVAVTLIMERREP